MKNTKAIVSLICGGLFCLSIALIGSGFALKNLSGGPPPNTTPPRVLGVVV
jgi:hypothetical protein